MYPKNAASPEPIAIGAVTQISDGAVQTSGVTVRIKPVGVAEADGAGTTSYSTDGIVIYTPTQAETNYTSFIVIAKKTGCVPVSQTIVTTASTTSGTVKLAPITHTSAVIPNVTTTGTVTNLAVNPNAFNQAQTGAVSCGASTIEWGPATFGQDSYAKGMRVRCVSADSGAGQERTVVSYVDSTGTMTLDRAWDVTPAGNLIFDFMWDNDLLSGPLITADAANKLAAVVMRRTMANVENASDGDALGEASLYGLVQRVSKSSTLAHANKLTIYKTDGTTELAQVSTASDASADPITKMGV